tara:strand:- start:2492 stop:3949 length:1458 start_codon:yes stop_codon:yes gene_type:complete
MLFNSYEFLFLFLPVTFFIYFFINSKKNIKIGKGFLVLSSLFFYGFWKPLYLPLLIISIYFNFTLGKNLASENYNHSQNKNLLILGIFLNLFLLGYFKYSNFFIANFNFALHTKFDFLNLILPLGISFFTFQQIAYLVDSFRKKVNEYDFMNYAVFISFFPQLIAGPIIYHNEIMPQFSNIKNNQINYNNIVLGIFIFGIGLFKKVVFADKFAIWANEGFDNSNILNLFEAWGASISYTFQLYFDFSGYTDMAIGIALLFNIILPVNFNSPYKAINIEDFWRRWHITLSRFLKDYVYIPLGGNKKGNLRTYRNLMITFLLAGIWHGAGWTFIFWGFLHAFALTVYKVWDKLGIKIHRFISWIITFNFINLSWVFFRAKNWSDAIKVIKGMVGLDDIKLQELFLYKFVFLKDYGVEIKDILNNIKGNQSTIYWIILGFIVILTFKNTNQILAKLNLSLFNVLFISIIYIISIGKLNEYSEFLYFNF